MDEVDAAFERRFAKIAMEPSREILEELLDGNGAVDPLRRRLLGFFSKVNDYWARLNPLAKIGHTFFTAVEDEASLRSVWDHQLKFIFEKAYRLDDDTLKEIHRDFEGIFSPQIAGNDVTMATGSIAAENENPATTTPIPAETGDAVGRSREGETDDH